VIQNNTVAGTTLAVSGGARHHTTMRTVTVIGHVTVTGSITSSTVILGVVVTVVTTACFPAYTFTKSTGSTLITTIATGVLSRNHSIVTAHPLVAVTEVLIVVVGLAVVGTLVNQTSSATYTDVA